MITNTNFISLSKDRHREGGRYIGGFTNRYRALIYALTKCLFNEPKILCNLDQNKNIKGIGMSDGDNLSAILSDKFLYTNTFYHKNPFLDIFNSEHVSSYNNLDFIISSDVFEHISPYPNIQYAFNNLFKMLKIGGHIIFSVPFIYDNYYEHFPSLYDYSIEFDNLKNKYYIKNKTIDGKDEILDKCKTPSGEIIDLLCEREIALLPFKVPISKIIELSKKVLI